MAFIKSFFKRQLNESELVKISMGAICMLSEKFFSMFLGFVVGAWFARYVGVSDFGKWSALIAIANLCLPIVALGIQSALSRDITLYPDRSFEFVVESIRLRIVGALVFVGFCIFVSMMLFPGETQMTVMAAVLAIGVAIQILGDIFQYYFRVNSMELSGSIALVFGNILNACIKVLLIFFGAPLLQFCLANVLGSLLAFVLACYFFFYKSNVRKRKYRSSYSLDIFRETWPLIFSQGFALTYLYIDQIMLAQIYSFEESGYYAAAVKISSILAVFPTVVGWALQSSMFKTASASRNLFLKRIRKVLRALILFGFLSSSMIFLASEVLIEQIFGSEFRSSAVILNVHIFAVVLLYARVSRGFLCTVDRKYKFEMWSNLGAALLNIGLNVLLIPRYGGVGAAAATVISYFFAYIGFGFFDRNIRNHAREQLCGLISFGIYIPPLVNDCVVNVARDDR